MDKKIEDMTDAELDAVELQAWRTKDSSSGQLDQANKILVMIYQERDKRAKAPKQPEVIK